MECFGVALRQKDWYLNLRMRRIKFYQTAVLVIILLAGTADFYIGARAETDPRKELALHYYRGVVYFEAGRYENALMEFQNVAAVDPYYKETQRLLKESMGKLDDYRQELFRTGSGPSLNQEDMNLYFLGRSYYEKGDYSRALEAFKSLLEKNPTDKYAQYYSQLCRQGLGEQPRGAIHDNAMLPGRDFSHDVSGFSKEVNYIKTDIRQQQKMEDLYQERAERRAERAEIIRKKEMQLKEQEVLLSEEKEDYLAQLQITKKAERIKKETQKWKTMKEKLASKQPGVPAELIEYPITVKKAEDYYVSMREALRMSRWNAAGLNAVSASVYFCDGLLIYFHGVRSASPAHENITRLLLENVARSDVEENVYHMRAILNLKKMIEDEDRPFTRAEALFLAQHAEKIAEWCKSLFP